jgi:hypothetical protein
MQSAILSIKAHKLEYNMNVHIVHFFLTWWFKNIGIILYAYSCIFSGITEFESGTTMVILFAVLTKEHVFMSCGILCSVLTHFIILLTVLFMYMYKSKKKIILFGSMLLACVPNNYNPYRDNLLLKLIVYCIVIDRIKKSPGLPITKYICFSWILFTHVGFLILLPIHIVYDTYYYKKKFNDV